MVFLCVASMVTYSLHCDLASFFFVLGAVGVLVSTGSIIENKRVQAGFAIAALKWAAVMLVLVQARQMLDI